MSAETEEYLTVEQLAARLDWSPKTVRNKMAPGGIFKKGVHYAEAPGLAVMFKWRAVPKLYDWTLTKRRAGRGRNSKYRNVNSHGARLFDEVR